MISLSLLQSCNKKKYIWEAGISAPKYYPVAGNVDFGNAGNGSNTSIAPGWGQSYGAVVGEKWKDVPKEVYIDYYSVVDGKGFKGKVLLPQEKIRDLFNEYNLDDEDNLGHLVVGMAPGGWIRVWFQALDEKADEYVNLEVAKGHLNGYKDETVGAGLKTKDFKTWGNTYSYWQHHGIPYEAWANNEREYDIYFDFNPAVVTDTFYTEFVTTLSNGDFNPNTVAIYPNPTADLITVENIFQLSISEFTLRDMTGKVINIKPTQVDETNLQLDLSHLNSGIYVLQINHQDHVETHKIIKK
jgi:hypothetical protein